MADRGVYCIKNIVSGRAYVGSSLRVVKRWHTHRSLLRRGKHHSIALQRSWDKHGESAFEFLFLEAVADARELIAREQHWIDRLRASHPTRGLNIRKIAHSQLGTKRSDESRRRMSEAAKRRAPETYAYKRSAPPWNKGKKMSPAYCQKMSDIQIGQKRGPLSASTRAKIGAANKGNASPFKGKQRSPEVIANMKRAWIKRKRRMKNERRDQHR